MEDVAPSPSSFDITASLSTKTDYSFDSVACSVEDVNSSNRMVTAACQFTAPEKPGSVRFQVFAISPIDADLVITSLQHSYCGQCYVVVTEDVDRGFQFSQLIDKKHYGIITIGLLILAACTWFSHVRLSGQGLTHRNQLMAAILVIQTVLFVLEVSWNRANRLGDIVTLGNLLSPWIIAILGLSETNVFIRKLLKKAGA
jgi:hypothetical protein